MQISGENHGIFDNLHNSGNAQTDIDVAGQPRALVADATYIWKHRHRHYIYAERARAYIADTVVVTDKFICRGR